MSSLRTQAKTGFLGGLKKGWSSFVWMCKIIIPVSFLITLLQWTGWLDQLDFLLGPLMSVIDLPPEAALPIISGMIINLYAAIAIITVLPFTAEQMTLIAIFTLVAHNLILEGMIQHKSGFSAIKATLIRITAAVLTVLIVSPFLGDTSQSVAVPASLTVHNPLLEVLKTWVIDTAGLLLKIFSIIMAIMIVLELSKALGWIEYLLPFSQPLMWILGLANQTVMMWVAATIFGLLYGGAFIAEEAKKGIFTRDELERLHIFIGINHAMVEDPALFAILGLNLFWLIIPKFVMAIIAVRTYRLIKYFKNKLLPD